MNPTPLAAFVTCPNFPPFSVQDGGLKNRTNICAWCLKICLVDAWLKVHLPIFLTKISTLLAGERGRRTPPLTLFQTIVNDCSYFIESLKINKLPVVDVGGHSNTDISTPLLVVNFLAVLTGHAGKIFLLFGAFSVLLPHALGSQKVSRHSLVAFCIAGRAPSRCQKLLRDRHRNACCLLPFYFQFLRFSPTSLMHQKTTLFQYRCSPSS